MVRQNVTLRYLVKMRSFSGRSHQKSRLCIPQPLHEYSVPVFDIFFLFSFRIFHVSLNPLKVSLQYIIKFNIIIYYLCTVISVLLTYEALPVGCCVVVLVYSTVSEICNNNSKYGSTVNHKGTGTVFLLRMYRTVPYTVHYRTVPVPFL